MNLLNKTRSEVQHGIWQIISDVGKMNSRSAKNGSQRMDKNQHENLSRKFKAKTSQWKFSAFSVHIFFDVLCSFRYGAVPPNSASEFETYFDTAIIDESVCLTFVSDKEISETDPFCHSRTCQKVQQQKCEIHFFRFFVSTFSTWDCFFVFFFELAFFEFFFLNFRF